MACRPAHVKPPVYLSANPPIPQPGSRVAVAPEPGAKPEPDGGDPLGLNPTRYGDWELKGIAIDF